MVNLSVSDLSEASGPCQDEVGGHYLHLMTVQGARISVPHLHPLCCAKGGGVLLTWGVL